MIRCVSCVCAFVFMSVWRLCMLGYVCYVCYVRALYMFAYGIILVWMCVVCVRVCIWRLCMFGYVHCVYVFICMSVCPLCMYLCVGTVHVRTGCVCM